MSNSDLRVHFLVGMSRSGITWLSRMLNLHPEVSVFGQSRFWGKHYISPDGDGCYHAEHRARLACKIRAFEWNATVGDQPGCLAGVTPVQFRDRLLEAVEETSLPITPAMMFLRIAEAVARLKSTEMVIEKTPHHVLYARRILDFFPEAKFVVLWCDALNYMRAMKAQSDLLYHPAAAALLWRRYNAACNFLTRERPDQTILVRYSDLKNEPRSELSRIFRHLELPKREERWALSRFYNGFVTDEEPADLSASDRFWISSISAVKQTKTSTSLSDILTIGASFVNLPVFAMRHLSQDWSEVEGSRPAYYRRWLTTREEHS